MKSNNATTIEEPTTTCSVHKQKRFIIFAARYLPLVGGVENYTYKLSATLAKRGFRVDIVTCNLSNDLAVSTQENGVRVWRLPAYGLMNGRLPITKRGGSSQNILRQLKESILPHEECFVVVNTRFYPHSILGAHFAQALGTQALVIEHGSQYLTLDNAVLDCAIRAYEHCISALVKLYKPLYAGVSLKACQWLKTFGIQTQKLVPNAIDPQEFRGCASQRDFHQEFALDPTKTVVSFVGRLCPEKGALTLAKAAQELPDTYFFFAGEGPERASLEALATPNIHVLGNLSKQDVSKLLQQSDIFCLPTRSEGFCTSLLEAFAQGCIPVIPDVGGTQELVDNQTGVCITEQARTNPHLLAQEIKRAQELVISKNSLAALMDKKLERYTWDASADALLKIADIQ